MHPRQATSQTEEAIPDIEPNERKELRRQAHRIYMARLVVINMLMESAMLALAAYAGTIPVFTAGLFFMVSMATSVGTYAFFKRGYNLKLQDKGLLVPQLLICGAVQVLFIFLAPNLTLFFLLVIFAFTGYAAIEFSPRQFKTGWLVYGAVSALALWLVRDRFAYPGTSAPELLLFWAFFFLTMRQIIMPGVSYARLRDKLSEKNRQLQASLRQIEILASRDALTGVLNRRRFMELLEAELQRSARSTAPFCFVMLDLDLFKAINDRYGHPVGDAVLKTTCDIAVQSLRAADQIGRLGGEEFALILTGTGPDGGLATMERLRQAVGMHDWDGIAPGLAVSFSAGLAGYVPGDNVHDIAKRADEALYRAKHAGRNCVMAAEAPHAACGAGAGR